MNPDVMKRDELINSGYGPLIVSLSLTRLIAGNIQQARLRLNYTQAYVARQLGISTLAYANIESAKNSTIKLDQLKQIGSILAIDADEIAGVIANTQSKEKALYLPEQTIAQLTAVIGRLCALLDKRET